MELAKEDIYKVIKEHGWFAAKYEATHYTSSCLCTVGLLETYNHPEIVLFGLPLDTLHDIAQIAVDRIAQGEVFKKDTSYDAFLNAYSCKFLKVEASYLNDYFQVALQYYNEDTIEALQLVWPDKNEYFPWDASYDANFEYKQPLLDQNTDFKFREPRNTAVFTTTHFLDQHFPILRVIHDEEGDWQFLTGHEFSGEDCKVMAMEEVVKKDRSLNALFHLNYGEYADRKTINDNWVIGSVMEEED